MEFFSFSFLETLNGRIVQENANYRFSFMNFEGCLLKIGMEWRIWQLSFVQGDVIPFCT